MPAVKYCLTLVQQSPSMRREWIEIVIISVLVNVIAVSLHAEGVH